MINFDDARKVITEIFNDITIEDMYEEGYGITAVSFSRALGLRNGINLYHGATRGVIAPYNKNYVFKINFTTRERFNDSDNIVEEEVYERTELTYDYCEEEEKFFIEATANNLAPYFAKMSFLGIIKGIPIYIQEKAILFIDGDYYCSHSSDIYNEVRNVESEYCATDFLPTDWMADFIDIYGTVELERLCQFLDDCGINDLHEGNVGYIDQSPVIVDYAGWYN